MKPTCDNSSQGLFDYTTTQRTQSPRSLRKHGWYSKYINSNSCELHGKGVQAIFDNQDVFIYGSMTSNTTVNIIEDNPNVLVNLFMEPLDDHNIHPSDPVHDPVIDHNASRDGTSATGDDSYSLYDDYDDGIHEAQCEDDYFYFKKILSKTF